MTWEETKTAILKIAQYEIALGCTPVNFGSGDFPARWFTGPPNDLCRKVRCSCSYLFSLENALSHLNKSHHGPVMAHVTFPEDQPGPLTHPLLSAGSVWSKVPQFKTTLNAPLGFEPASWVTGELDAVFYHRASRYLLALPSAFASLLGPIMNQEVLCAVLDGSMHFDPVLGRWSWRGPKKKFSPKIAPKMWGALKINVPPAPTVNSDKTKTWFVFKTGKNS